MGHVHPKWLEQRPGESRDDWLIRTARSCYYCPHEPFPDAFAASDHEDVCTHNPAVHKDQDRRR